MTDKITLQEVNKLFEKHKRLIPAYFHFVFSESFKRSKPTEDELKRIAEVLNDEAKKLKKI